MNILSAIMILGSCVYFYLGFAFLTGVKKKKAIHWLFLFMIISLFGMAASCTLAYSALNKSNHIFWFRWTITFLLIYMGLATHFCISLTGLVKLRPWHIILLYVPTPIFLFKHWTSFIYMKEFVKINSIWRLSPHPVDAWYVILSVYMAGYTMLSLIFLFLWMRKAHTVKKKRQARILFLTMGITFIGAMGEGIIIPAFTGYNSIALGPIVIAVWITGILYCLVKYKFINPASGIVSAELSNNMNEIIIIFGLDLSVLFVNRTALAHLELTEHDASRKTVKDLFREAGPLTRELTLLSRQNGYRSVACHVTLRGEGGKEIKADSRFSIITDKYNDTTGILFTGREIMSMKNLQSLYKLSAREIQVIREIHMGSSNRRAAETLKITERTVKNHLTNIFNKLGIDNRIQLITLLEDYRIVPQQHADKKVLLL